MARSAVTAEASEPLGLLDKARIIAPPGFNRWLVPPAALAIHLCIGMAYGFSVFWLPLGRAVGVAEGLDKAIPCAGDATTFFGKVAITAHALFATNCDWTQFDLGWMYTLFFVLLGVSAAIWGGWLERVGPRKAGVVAAFCWCRRADDLGVRRLHPPTVADVARLGHHRRLRPRPRLYLARLDADQMVPRSPRHGDRHGHHGLRRRRHDRFPARHHPDEPLRHADLGRRVGDLRHHGGDLFRLHDVRRVRLPAAAARMETRGLDAAGKRQGDDHHRPRPPQGRPQDRAVLAALGGAVPQRLGRHRHHRRRRADVAGDLRREAVRRSIGRLRQFHRRAEGQGGAGRRGLCRAVLAVQYRRPLLLGLALRHDRAQGAPISSSSRSASSAMRPRRPLPRLACSACSRQPSA